MASRKTLLARVHKAIREGDRRPEVLVLREKIKRAPQAIVHGFTWQVEALLN